MPKVAVIAKLTAAEGKRDDLRAALADVGMRNAAGEPGTLVYSLHADTRDPDVFWFFEVYEDSDALAAHRGSDGMKQMNSMVGPLVGAKTEIHVLEPVAAKGLDV